MSKRDTAEFTSWWVSIDGWQFESGEFPILRRDEYVEFPLEFNWISVQTVESDPARQALVTRRWEGASMYHVSGTYRAVPGKPGMLTVGIDLRQTGAPVRELAVKHRAKPITVVGQVRVGGDTQWTVGERPDHIQCWLVDEILESRSRIQATAADSFRREHIATSENEAPVEWHRVASTRPAADRTYLAHCNITRPRD